MTDSVTFAKALQAFWAAKSLGVDLSLITSMFVFQEHKASFYAYFEKHEDGCVIKGSASAPDPAEAIVAAWEKFEGLARHGAPRMLAGLLEQPTAAQPKLAPAFIDLPSVDPDDEIPF